MSAASRLVEWNAVLGSRLEAADEMGLAGDVVFLAGLCEQKELILTVLRELAAAIERPTNAQATAAARYWLDRAHTHVTGPSPVDLRAVADHLYSALSTIEAAL